MTFVGGTKDANGPGYFSRERTSWRIIPETHVQMLFEVVALSIDPRLFFCAARQFSYPRQVETKTPAKNGIENRSRRPESQDAGCNDRKNR